MHYLKLLRPHQWLKNLMIYFPPFLGGVLLQPGLAARGVLPLVSFCLASSAGYILNDIRDCENDRQHPEKKARAIPSGRISVGSASLLGMLLVIGAGFAGWQVSIEFFFCFQFSSVPASVSARKRDLVLLLPIIAKPYKIIRKDFCRV